MKQNIQVDQFGYEIKAMHECPFSKKGTCVILCPFCEGRGYVSDAMYNTLHATVTVREAAQ